MRRPSPKRVVKKYAMRSKVAGEVRFIKDNTSGDLSGDWAYTPNGSSERQIGSDFMFNPRELKPLAKSLRSALMALGHATSCYNTFVKIKSRKISPDGQLGGKGYIMEISKVRKGLMNCIEVLSSITDCMYDEILAPHWNPAEDEMTPRDREEVVEIVDQIKEIQEDPEEFAEKEEKNLDDELGDK